MIPERARLLLLEKIPAIMPTLLYGEEIKPFVNYRVSASFLLPQHSGDGLLLGGT